MSGREKPPIKLFMQREAFNTFWAMLQFYVASEQQAGKTFYSELAEKFIWQFEKFGNFIEKKNADDNLFMIYLYEGEILKIVRLYNKYITVHTKSPQDFFTEIMADKKSRLQ